MELGRVARGGDQMSQEHAWTLEEMARAILSDRLAEARHDRLAKSVRGVGPSPRVVLANALRSLATILDGEVSVRSRSDRRLARA
jgi:hypothetical protein